jgi:GNAT superfamily N-acetyltransferase
VTESTDRPTVEQVARDAVGWLRTGPQAARLDDPRFVLLDRPLSTPWFANALRLRLHDDEVADVIETARRWFGARGRTSFSWFVSDESTPRDLGDALVRAGAVVEDSLTAMVLDHEPEPGHRDVIVRPVRTLAEFRAYQELFIAGFGFSRDLSATMMAEASAAWRHWQSEPGRVLYVASIDGLPVAEGGIAETTAGPMVLSGGSTRPEARGRGAYRALVRARWDEAVRRGHPQLVAQASAMSQPVLQRAGFRPVGTVTLYADRAL